MRTDGDSPIEMGPAGPQADEDELRAEAQYEYEQEHGEVINAPSAFRNGWVEGHIVAAEKYSKPDLAREQPCGCVTCLCNDELKCHGCGSKTCEDWFGPQCVFNDANRAKRIYMPHPLVERIAELEAEVKDLEESCRLHLDNCQRLYCSFNDEREHLRDALREARWQAEVFKHEEGAASIIPICQKALLNRPTDLAAVGPEVAPSAVLAMHRRALGESTEMLRCIHQANLGSRLLQTQISDQLTINSIALGPELENF